MRARLALVTKHPAFGSFVALGAVFMVFAVLRSDTFLRGANLITMAQQTVVVFIAAIGMTLVIAHGGIDLSVGSSVALTTVIVASLLRAGWGPWSASLAGVLAAGAIGSLTGLIIARTRVAPFIVTLGCMSALRGIAKGLANEAKVDADAKGLDTLLTPGAGGGGVPPGVIIALGVGLVVAVMLRTTRFGRHIFAVGSNEEASRLAGVDVPRLKTMVYAIAGVLTGLAGVMAFGNLTVGDPTTSVGLELEVIAAVVIGGASLSGGQGSIAGALTGALFMTVIKTGCTHLGLPNWVQEIVTGAIIVTAAIVDRVRALASLR
jgi:ribose/xylose/arabinose/galactoside ABC-type transport system permease subunit